MQKIARISCWEQSYFSDKEKLQIITNYMLYVIRDVYTSLMLFGVFFLLLYEMFQHYIIHVKTLYVESLEFVVAQFLWILWVPPPGTYIRPCPHP